jgi:hypothetical protein
MQETSLKTYNFFNHRETISNISNDYEKLTLNDLNSLKIYAYDKYIFLSCRINNTNQNEKNKPKQTNEYSIIQIFHNQIITNYYHVFNRKLISFCIRKIKFIPHIFCIGCDFKYIQLGSDRTFMTLYSVKIFPINTTINTINDELFLKNLITINLIKDRDTKELLNSDNFLINSESISDINGFDVDEKGEQIVIGSSNGEIILIRNIKKYNDKKEYNISLLVKSTKLDITNVKFGRSLNNDILIYVTTENEIIYYMLNKNTNIYEFNFIYTDNGCQKNVFDVNSITNKVIFCSMINSSLEEINNFDRGACWLFEGSKQKINFFGENLILLNDNNLLVYDSKNKFFSYNTKVLLDKKEQFKVIDFFCSFEKKTIYMIIEKKNNNEEDNDYIDTTKEIIILKEIPAEKKLEQFYIKNEYSEVERYIKQNPNLYDIDLTLAQIALKKGDDFYIKGEYKNAINEYKKSIFHVSPNIVIEKFLDSSKLEFLILFLEELNNNIKYNMTLSEEKRKNYIIMLLYCYLRGKKENKMNEFIQKAYLNKQFLIIRAALNICKKNNLKELALMIVEKGNIIELKIEVLIDIFHNYKEALNLLKDCDNYLCQYLTFSKHYLEFYQNEKELFIAVFLLFFKHFTKIKIGEEIIISRDKTYLDKFNKITYANVINILTDDSLNNIKLQMIDYIIANDENYPIDIIQMKIEILVSNYSLIEDDKQKKLIEEKIIDIIKNKKICKSLDKNYLKLLFEGINFQNGLLILYAVHEDKLNLLNYYMEHDMYNKIIAVTDEFGSKNSKYYLQILNYFISKINDENKSDFESYIKVLMNKINDKGLMNPNIIKVVSNKLKDKIKFSLLKPYILNIMKEKYNTYQSTLKEKEKILDDLNTMKKEIDTIRNKIIFPIPKKCLSCLDSINKEEDAICYGCKHTFHKRCLMAARDKDEEGLECVICKAKNMRLGQALKQREETKELYNNYLLELKAENGNKKLDVFAKYLGKGIFDKNN